MTANRIPGIRERNRAEITAAILATARSQLASEGAAGLSLRAVARDLGMASSAIYRYFPSRDDLLTRLIIEAYSSLADAVEGAEAAEPREDLAGRFRAVGHAIRRWAFDHEHEYALIYGSPVPGYRAPQDTIASAARVGEVMIRILAEGVARDRLHATTAHLSQPPVAVSAAIEPVRAAFTGSGADIPDELIVRGLMAWTYLFGAVSFDLFGHRHNVVTDERNPESAFFAEEVRRVIEYVGLSDPAAPAGGSSSM